MPDEEQPKISKYNSGIAIIMRLDVLWKDTHTHSRSGQYYKWNLDLDRIWCELSRDLEETDYTEKKKLFDDFETKLSQKGEIKDNLSSSFDTPSQQDVKNRKEQYKILMEKELFLRRLENTLGKGTAWDEDEEGFE